MQLWDGCGGAEAKTLRVTLVCAGCKLGAEGGRRVKSIFERNTTLTLLTLWGERVTCVEGGRVFFCDSLARRSPPSPPSTFPLET